MKITVRRFKDNDVYARALGRTIFFDKFLKEKPRVGQEVDVMIIGHGTALDDKGLPKTIFVRPIVDEILVTAPILETTGAVCSASTYHDEYGSIYAGDRAPVPVVENVGRRGHALTEYLIPEIQMYIKKGEYGTYYAVGVEHIEHLSTVFLSKQAVSEA